MYLIISESVETQIRDERWWCWRNTMQTHARVSTEQNERVARILGNRQEPKGLNGMRCASWIGVVSSGNWMEEILFFLLLCVRIEWMAIKMIVIVTPVNAHPEHKTHKHVCAMRRAGMWWERMFRKSWKTSCTTLLRRKVCGTLILSAVYGCQCVCAWGEVRHTSGKICER